MMPFVAGVRLTALCTRLMQRNRKKPLPLRVLAGAVCAGLGVLAGAAALAGARVRAGAGTTVEPEMSSAESARAYQGHRPSRCIVCASHR